MPARKNDSSLAVGVTNMADKSLRQLQTMNRYLQYSGEISGANIHWYPVHLSLAHLNYPKPQFARYSALLVGVVYGSRHNKTLTKREAEILAIKKVRDEEMAAKKAEEAKLVVAGDTGSIFD